MRPYEAVKCVPKRLCYRFMIVDTNRGGGLESGGYTITYNDELIKESKFEKSVIERVKFGDGC